MDVFAHLAARADQNRGCTQATCPVIQSVYGYRPNLGATVFFLILFALSACIFIWQGVRTKTRFFTWAMVLGGFSEVLGYVAKLLLWKDPFSDVGFKMSVVLLTFAPAFYAAGVYYTLKHICLTFGADFSRLRPALYTYIFISCDLFSIVLQAVGGALASVSSDMSLLNAGTNVMIAGLVLQVFTLLVFGMLAADYAFAVFRNRENLNPATAELRSSLRFKLFVGGLWLAWLCIEIRCAYRVAELVGGWVNNPILRNEYLFICLDSLPIGIAALALNILHPGWCFPKESQGLVSTSEKLGNSSDTEGMSSV
ncbi:hypothetical protein BAUCODRAFT_150821 [Baudoinia panamericana UAMH 10762]|uniref:RTA1 like protein n=1 Tax=Baudoinia panamericana (strain UAMH 10762) TaxID=717646 RepID=M2MPY9_BAUPA|nr:uncharacterized protein BAUCODRAFT_150821 [Baudoinia panamericana UAMH 10762]EMC93503.1 hypothetical protein BAUCODRAFT_150821 [Baudoinia panamericana UAMH 10762]